MTIKINITPNGRMILPADMRKRMGLSAGGTVYVEESGDGLVLRTAAQAVAKAQALAKLYPNSPADASEAADA